MTASPLAEHIPSYSQILAWVSARFPHAGWVLAISSSQNNRDASRNWASTLARWPPGASAGTFPTVSQGGIPGKEGRAGRGSKAIHGSTLFCTSNWAGADRTSPIGGCWGLIRGKDTDVPLPQRDLRCIPGPMRYSRVHFCAIVQQMGIRG